jgi:hypothetical protein
MNTKIKIQIEKLKYLRAIYFEAYKNIYFPRHAYNGELIGMCVALGNSVPGHSFFSIPNYRLFRLCEPIYRWFGNENGHSAFPFNYEFNSLTYEEKTEIRLTIMAFIIAEYDDKIMHLQTMQMEKEKNANSAKKAIKKTNKQKEKKTSRWKSV